MSATIRKYTPKQIAPIGDIYQAQCTLIAACLEAMLHTVAAERADWAQGAERMTLEQLAYFRNDRHEGEYGICWEYAIHDAIVKKDPLIHNLVSEVLEGECKIKMKDGAQSILFGPEKGHKVPILKSREDVLNEDSRVLVGKAGKPPQLKKHLADLRKAASSIPAREKLPKSIEGLWKADLFLGDPAPNQWVGVTAKTNPGEFEAANGLRLGVYPMLLHTGEKQVVRKDDEKNLILVALPYKDSFSEQFYLAMSFVRRFLSQKLSVDEKVVPHAVQLTIAAMLVRMKGDPVYTVCRYLREEGSRIVDETTITEEQVKHVLDLSGDDGKLETGDLFQTPDAVLFGPLPDIGKAEAESDKSKEKAAEKPTEKDEKKSVTKGEKKGTAK